MMRLDFRIVGVLFFTWGMLNFTDGINNTGGIDLLNTSKGIIGVILGLYIYSTSTGLLLPYQQNGEQP